LTFEGGWSTEHEKWGVNLQTNLNLLGTTRQEQALRFGEEGEDAPLVDLSDYLVQARGGPASLMVGHVSYGNHRHLLNRFVSRGVVTRLALFDRFDVSFSSVNGRSIVGWDNPLGLQDVSENNLTAATVGIEILQAQPGALRFEATGLTGRVLPETSFNVGEVVDAEESQGFGLRLLASLLSNRVRGDFSFARSSFDNPQDPQLSEGVDVVEVEETTKNARYFELAVDVLRDLPVWAERSVSLTLLGRHERVDPLYRSVGAFTPSDLQTYMVGGGGRLMVVSFQVQYTWTKDNLDDIPTILTTKTRDLASSFAIPLQNMLANRSFGGPWLPNLTYSYGRVHQFATDASGVFPPSFVPDQVSDLHNLGAEWFGQRWSFGYLFSLNLQDNRQEEREEDDFRDITHSVSLTIQPWDPLTLNLGLSQTDQTDEGADLRTTTRSANVGGEWRFLPEWVFSGNFSFTDEGDSQSQFDGESYTVDAILSRQFHLFRLRGYSLGGNSFLRYSLQSNRSEDRTFDLLTDARVWTVNFGASLSFE
jgi:hypothetical protein